MMISGRTVCLISALIAAYGCATSKKPAEISGNRFASIAEVVADVAESQAGNLAVMNGIQDHVVPTPTLEKGNFAGFVAELAKAGGYSVYTAANYYLILPESYAALRDLSLNGKLDASHEAMRVPITLGFDTPLYAAFALLGQALDTTIVGDQIIAAAKSGALTFNEIPLKDAMEGVLQSARVAGDLIEVESTPEYIFISAKQNPARGPMLLNKDALTPEQNARLDALAHLAIPAVSTDGTTLRMTYGAQSLEAVLPALSEQLKIRVTAETEMMNLPVNPFVMNRVSLRVALDLLIRQWPTDRYGYEIVGDEVRLKARKQE